jgi:hypothetical protein
MTLTGRVMMSRTATACALVAAFVRTIAVSGEVGLQESSWMETQDDLLVQVETQAPGFGGMYIDSEGRLVLYLLDTAQLPAARSAIEAVFGPDRVPPAGVRAVKGQYTVSQLAAWTRRAAAVLELTGVTLVDLDEARNRVAIGVDDPSRVRTVAKALLSMKIPRAAVVIDVTGPIRPVNRR